MKHRMMPRLAAVLLLGTWLPSPSARADELPALREQACSATMRVRRAALKQLEALGTAGAAEALVAAAAAADARQDTVGVADVAYSVGKVGGPAMAPVLRTAYPGAPAPLKAPIVEALGRLGDVDGAPMLRDLSRQHDNPTLARVAYLSLAAVTHDRDDALRIVADLADPHLSNIAAQALARLSFPAFAPDVLPVLHDADLPMDVTVAAIQALGHMGVPEAAGPLIDLLEQDKRYDVRRYAGEALVRIADPSTAPRLLRLYLAHGGMELSAAFLAADRRQGWSLMRQLMARKPGAAAGLLDAVAFDVHPATDEPLAKVAVDSGDVRIRGEGVEVLCGLRTESAEALLCRELKRRQNDSTTRETAAEGMAHFATDSAVRCLIETVAAEQAFCKGRRIRFENDRILHVCVRTLQAMTGEHLGPDAAAWRTWFEAHRKPGEPVTNP